MQPVSLTEVARREVTKILVSKNIPEGYGLRVGVKGGRGCAGVNYLIGFDKQKPDDLCYYDGDIQILVSKKEVMFLMGVRVDFYDGADERGFTFLSD